MVAALIASSLLMLGALACAGEYIGRIQPVKQLSVCSSEDGRVVKVYVAEGDRLKAGDAMARVNNETLAAPSHGVVFKLYKREGDKVTKEEKILDCVDTDQVQVTTYLPESQRVELRPGEKKTVIAETGERALGEIVFPDPRPDPATGLFMVWIRIENTKGKFKVGQKVKVRFD